MRRLIALETRLLHRDLVAVIVLLLMGLTCGLAVANGRARIESQTAGRAIATAGAAKADTATAQKLAVSMDPVEAILLPFRINLGGRLPRSRRSSMPPPAGPPTIPMPPPPTFAPTPTRCASEASSATSRSWRAAASISALSPSSWLRCC